MRVTGAAVLALATACGRLGFDTVGDGGARAADGASADGTHAADGGDGHAPAPPIALVQAIGARGSGTTVTATFASPAHAGDVVIVALDGGEGAGETTLMDSFGDPYTTVVGPASEPIGILLLAYAVASASGSCSVTAQFDTPVSTELRIHELSGLATTGTFDADAIGSGVAAGVASPPQEIVGPQLTTSAANELVFGFELSGIATAGSESTLALAFDSDITEYELAPTAATYQPTAELTNGSTWAIVAGAFHGQ